MRSDTDPDDSSGLPRRIRKKPKPIFRVFVGRRTICCFPKVIFNGNPVLRRRRQLSTTRKLNFKEKQKIDSVMKNNRKLVDMYREQLDEMRSLLAKNLTLHKELLIHRQNVKHSYKEAVQIFCEKMMAERLEAEKQLLIAEKALEITRQRYCNATNHARSIFMTVNEESFIEFSSPTRTFMSSANGSNPEVFAAGSSSDAVDETDNISPNAPPDTKTVPQQPKTRVRMTEAEKENHRRQALARQEEKFIAQSPLTPLLEISSKSDLRSSISLNMSRPNRTFSLPGTPSSFEIGVGNDCSTGRKSQRGLRVSQRENLRESIHQRSSQTPSIYNFEPRSVEPVIDELQCLSLDKCHAAHETDPDDPNCVGQLHQRSNGDINCTPGDMTMRASDVPIFRPSFLTNASFLNQIDYYNVRSSEIPTDFEYEAVSTILNTTMLETSPAEPKVRSSARTKKKVSYEEPKCNRKVREGHLEYSVETVQEAEKPKKRTKKKKK